MTHTELAKLALTSKHWHWLPGMSAQFTIGQATYHSVVLAVEQGAPWFGTINSFYTGALPDLTDPATLGCLLHLNQQARQDPTWHPYGVNYGGEQTWWLYRPSNIRQTSHSSYASVLVAALLENLD